MITTAFSAANAARPRKDGKIVRKVRIDGQDREFLWDPKVPFDDRAKAKVVELFRRSDLKSAKNYAVSAGLNPDEILKSYNPGPYKYFDKLGRRVEPDPFVKAVTQLDNGRVGLPVGLKTVERAPYDPGAPVQSTEVIDYLKDTVAKRLGEKVPLTAKRGDPLQIIMRGYDEKFKNDPKWAINRPKFKEQVLKMLGPGYGSGIASGLTDIATNYKNNGKWQRDLEDEKADVARLQKTAGLTGERAKQTFREGQVIRMLAENGMIPAHYVKYAAPYERSAKIGSGTVDKASQLAQEADLNVQLRDMSGLEWAISGLMNPVSTINSALLGMTPRQAMANMTAGQKFAVGAADLIGGLALGNAAFGAMGALFKTGGAVGMGEMGVGRALGQAAARELAVGVGPMAAQFAITANKRGLEEALREVNPLSPLTDPSADWADKTLGVANAAMLGLGAYHGVKNFGPVLRTRVENLIPGLKGMGLSDSALMRAEMLYNEFKNQFREKIPVIGTPYGKSDLSNSKASYLVENFIKSEVAEKRAQLERTVGPEEAAKVSDAKIAEKVLSGALSAYHGRVNPIFRANQHDKEAQAANDLAMASLLGGNEHAANAYSAMAQKLQRKADMAGRQPIPAVMQELSTALANTTVKPLPRSETFVPVPQPKPFVVSDAVAQEPVNPALAAAGQHQLDPVNPVVQLDRTPVPAPSPEGYAKTGWNEAVGKTIDQSLADIREEGAKLPQYKKTTALPPEQALMRTFKGFNATKTDDGYELVHNKTGKKILIRDVKRIDANGVELKPGEFIGGEARVLEVDGQPMSLEGVITLAQGGRHTTAYHEAFHVMEKMGLLRRDEWEHLHKNYGDGKSGSPVENIADAYESWLAGRGTDDRVFTKIKRFFGDVRDFLFNHTEWKKSKVFRDMESGKVWDREVGAPERRGMPRDISTVPAAASKQSHSVQTLSFSLRSRYPQVVRSIKQEKATGEQWLAMLSKSLKSDELEYSGIKRWLAGNAGKTLTKAQLLDWAAEHQMEMYVEDRKGPDVEGEWLNKYTKYGKKNYTERLYKPAFQSDEDGTPYGWTRSNPGGTLKHWADRSVVAHARFGEQVLPDGSKSLHLSEAQSDLHHIGSKHGYKGDNVPIEAYKELYDTVKGKLQRRLKNLNESASNLRIANVYSSVSSELKKTLGIDLRKPLKQLTPQDMDGVLNLLDERLRKLRSEKDESLSTGNSQRYHELVNEVERVKRLSLDFNRLHMYVNIRQSLWELHRELTQLGSYINGKSDKLHPDAVKSLERLTGMEWSFNKIANLPYKGQKYAEMILRDMVAEAVFKNIGQVTWDSGAMQIKRWSGTDAADKLTHIYDKILVRHAKDLEKKYGLKYDTVDMGDGDTVHRLTIPEEAADKIKDEGLPAYSIQNRTTVKALPHDATEALIKSVYKGASIERDPEGYTVNTKAGRVRIVVADHIAPDETILLNDYGIRGVQPGLRVASSWRLSKGEKTLGVDGLITLARGAGRRELLHESFHNAVDFGLITNKEWSALMKRYGTEEKAAMAYEQWAARPKGNTVFQRLRQRAVDLLNAIAHRREIKLFREMKAGTIWEREAVGVENAKDHGVKYAVRAANLALAKHYGILTPDTEALWRVLVDADSLNSRVNAITSSGGDLYAIERDNATPEAITNDTPFDYVSGDDTYGRNLLNSVEWRRAMEDPRGTVSRMYFEEPSGKRHYNLTKSQADALAKKLKVKLTEHREVLSVFKDPTLVDDLDKLEKAVQSIPGLSTVKLFERNADGKIIGLIESMMEQRRDASDPTKALFKGLRRTVGQTIIDNLPEPVFEKVRGQMYEAVRRAVKEGKDAGAPFEFARWDPIKQAPMKGPKTKSAAFYDRNIDESGSGDFGTAPALKGSEKTVAAINLTSACPMIQVGGDWCYADACYVAEMAKAGQTIPFYYRSMYTGEVLQLSDESIRLLNSVGGLRLNGWGDTEYTSRHQLKDIFRDAEARGLKLKIISKQETIFKILQEYKNEGGNIDHIIVQPTVDPYYVRVDRMEKYTMAPGVDPKAESKNTLAGLLGGGKVPEHLKGQEREDYIQAVRDMYREKGREIHVDENGDIWRKYGFTFEQAKELKQKYPDVNIHVRTVLATYEEIAKTALMGDTIQTWMHATIREPFYSDILGRVVTPEETANFKFHPAIFKDVNGDWHIYAAQKGHYAKGDLTDALVKAQRKLMDLADAGNLDAKKQAVAEKLRATVNEYNARLAASAESEEAVLGLHDDRVVGQTIGVVKEYDGLEKYIKANFTSEEQEKIFSTLQRGVCCGAGFDADSCADCLGHCASRVKQVVSDGSPTGFATPEELIAANAERLSKRNTLWQVMGNDNARAAWVAEQVKANEKLYAQSLRAENKDRADRAEKLAVNMLIGEIGADKYASMASKELKSALKGLMDRVYEENPELAPVPIPSGKALRDASEADWIAKGRPHLVGEPFIPLSSAEPAPVRVAPKQSTEVSFSVQKRKASLADAVKDPEFYDHIVSGQRTAPDKAPYLRQIIRAAGGLESGQFDVGGLPAENTKGRKNILITLENTRKLFFGDTKEGQKEYELARLIVNRLPEPVIKDVSLLHAPVVEDGAYGAAYTHPAVNAIVIATKGSSKHPEEFANTLVHEFVHVAQQYIPERMMVRLVKEFRTDIERLASSRKLKNSEEYARIERAMDGKDRSTAAKAAFAEWLAGKVSDGLVEKARAMQSGPLSKMVYALKRVMRVAARALLDAPSDKAVNEMIKSLSNPDVQWVRERSSLVAPLFKEEPFDARDCGEAFWRLKRGEVDTPDYKTADDALLNALRDFLTDRKGSAPTDEELYTAYWSGLQSFGESMIPHGEQFAVDAFTSSLMNEFANTGKVDTAEALHRADLGIKKVGDVFGPTDMEAFKKFLEANGFKNLSPEEVRSAFFMSYAAAQARYASEGLNYGGFERLVLISHAGSDYSRPGLNLGARTDYSGQTIQQMLEESRKIGSDEVFGKASSVLQPDSRETFTSTEQMAAARFIEDQRAEQIRYLRVALNLQEAIQSDALNPEKAKTPAERASIEAARDHIATEAMKYYNMYTAATVRAGTLLDALDKTGSEWGRMGRARQELYNNMLHDPRLAYWIAEARKSGIPYMEYFRRRIKDGGTIKLTPEEEAQVAVNTTATMGQSLKIQLEKAKIVIEECQSKIRKLQDQLEKLRKAGKAGDDEAKGQAAPEGETGKAGGRKKKAKDEGQAADVEPDDGTKQVYDLFEKFRKAYNEIEAKVNFVEEKMSKALDKMRTDPSGRAEYVEQLKQHSLEMEQLTKWYKLLTAELQRGRDFYIRMGNGKLAAFADALHQMDDGTFRDAELMFGKMRQKPEERAKKDGSNRSQKLEDGDPGTNAIADFTGTLRDIRKAFDSNIEEYSELNMLNEAMARLQNAIIDPKKREQIVRDMIRKEAERQNEKAKFATAKITEFDRPDRPFLMDAGEWEQLKANASTPEGKMALENAKKYAETEWQAMVKERDFLKQKEVRTPEEEDRLKSLQRRIKDALDERANEQADAIAEHGPKLADDIERGAYAKWLMQLAFDAETREALLKRKRKLELELDPDTEGRKLDRKPAPKPVERHQQIRAEIAMLDKIVSMHAELRKLANEIATGEYSAPSTKKPLPEVVQESVDRIAQQHHYHSLEKTYRELSKMRDVRRRTKAIEVALKLGHSGEPNAQDAYGMLLDALGYEQAKTSVPYSRSLQAEVEKLKTLETYAEKFIDTLKVTGFWEAVRKIDRALIFTALGNRMQDFVFNGVKSIVENNWISQAIDKGLEHIVFPRAGGETSMLTFRGPDKALMLMKMNAKATMGAMREIAEFSKEMGKRVVYGRKTKFVEVPTENIGSGEKYGVGTTINTADAFLVPNATLYHKAMHGLMSRLDAVVNLINATPGATDMTFVRGARNANLVSMVDSLTEEFKRANPGVEPEKIAKFRQDIMDGKGDLGQRAHLVAEVEAAEQVFLGAGGPIETWFTAISDTAQLKRATVQTGLDKGELAVPKNFAGFLGFMSDVLLTEFPKIFIRITNYNTDFIPGSALLKAPFIVAKQNAKSKAFAHDMGYKSVKEIPSGIKWDPRAGWDAVSKKRIVQLLRRQMYGMAALYAAYLYAEKEKRGEAPPLCRYDEATGRWIFDTVNILERIPVVGKALSTATRAVQDVPFVGNFISLDNLGGPMSLFCYGYAMMRADQDPAITTPEKAESARWKMFFDYCYSNPLLTSIAKLTALLTSNGGVGQAAKVYLGRAVIGTLVPGIVRGEASRRDMVEGIFTRKVEDWSDILASYIPGDGFLGLRGRNTLPITQAGKVMPSLNKEEQLIYRDCRYNPVGIRDASTDPESKAIGDRARTAYETIGAAFARLSMRSKDFQVAPNLPPKEDLAKGVPAGYVCKYNYLRERNSEAVDAAMACATMGLSDNAVRAIADYGLAIKNPLAVSRDKYSETVPVPDEYAKAISLAVGKKVEGILSNPDVRRFIDANKHLNYTGWMQNQIDRAVRSALSELKGDLVYSVSRQVAGQLQAEASRAASAETQYIDKHLGPVMDYDKINNSIAVMVKSMVDRNNAKVKARLERKRRTEGK